MTINRKSVISSNLASVGYDEDSRTLEVEFVSGSVYQYTNVPLRIYTGLMNDISKGEYFDENVKKGGYHFRQIR